ncbi:hypothetical protein ACMU_00100 [Actibacterium mucosum KCTC 23349]|uniref:Signal peptidase I n=2 Tax=Actibacterium TaxID=1433986 RepID=A0A037ZKJ5_9RHOB|nr:hypothetical protein ACMU_00100 [Actibacterium mucosum KCTC 23349]
MLFLVSVLSLRAFYEPFWIPSASMVPSLRVGDYLIVSRHNKGPLERGEIVVFQHPTRGGEWIKRIIALEGDSVQIVDGAVILNGAPLAYEPKDDFVRAFRRHDLSGGMPMCGQVNGQNCITPASIEILPSGKSHLILDARDSSLDNTAVYKVPSGHMFLLGDHRDNSLDSRVAVGAGGLGFVPTANVTGRKPFLIFSSSGMVLFNPFSWRRDRYLQAIQ